MCSIAGYLRSHRPTTDTGVLRSMNSALARRGPDGSGLLVAEGAPQGRVLEIQNHIGPLDHRVGLAHNRFAITDLTDAGRQPFRSPDGRYTLVFNGEIYNHRSLRPQLEKAGWHFRSTCDTEVLLAAFAIWGESCFGKLNGFWACAIWDNHLARLTLSRDRFGEAPLFYTIRDSITYFASEIPALQTALGRDAFTVSKQAVADYLFAGLSDVEEATFYEEIRQLPAGSLATLSPGKPMEIRQWWTMPNQRLTDTQLSPQDAVDQLRAALTRAVELRLDADVPVGFQLSGGMDSSALVALAASRGKKVTAYTVSYPGTRHDEMPLARQVADLYPGQIDHRELRALGDEFWDHADDVIGTYAEPFSGPNTFTQQLTWRALSKQGIKVVLNGGAGDELLAGYRRDFHAPFLAGLWREGDYLRAAHESAALSEDRVRLLSRANFRRLRTALAPSSTSMAGCLSISSPGSASHPLPAHLSPARNLPRSRSEPGDTLDERIRTILGSWRLAYYNKNANVASLAVPVELRFPFLDADVAQLALTLPRDYLIRDGWMKWILRKVAEPLLPKTVTWRRKKMGFPFPYQTWTMSSKRRYLAALADTRCPFLDHAHLVSNWEVLAVRNPIFLWRCMSLGLWWRKCVEGRALDNAPATAGLRLAA